MKKIKKKIMDNGFLPLNKTAIKKLGLVKTGVLQSLIDCQDYFEKELFFKSKQEIADELGLHSNTVEKYISELIKDGYINLSGKTGNNRNLYSLNTDMILSIIEDTSSENIVQQMDNNCPTENKIEIDSNCPTDVQILSNSRTIIVQQIDNNCPTDVQNLSKQNKQDNKEKNKEYNKELPEQGNTENLSVREIIERKVANNEKLTADEANIMLDFEDFLIDKNTNNYSFSNSEINILKKAIDTISYWKKNKISKQSAINAYQKTIKADESYTDDKINYFINSQMGGNWATMYNEFLNFCDFYD